MAWAAVVVLAWAMTPMLEPRRLMVSLPMMFRPAQTMPCCIAKVSRYCKVESLSPLG